MNGQNPPRAPGAPVEITRLASQIGLGLPRILLPAEGLDLARWPVVACDQFTSEPEYWQEAAAFVGSAPSTLHMILPELYLEHPGDQPLADRIASINRTMRRYLTDGTLRELAAGFILTERSTPWHASRKGLIAAIDLACYDYRPGSRTLIRPSEGTVVERIPPRLQIRRDAPLELPHIEVLIDDPGQQVIEPLFSVCAAAPPLYETPLMLQGGALRAWFLPADSALLRQALTALGNLDSVQQLGLLGAVGDGNHSLATAKAHWESLRGQVAPEHPARYALVELVNIHDGGLDFEPIHRALFGVEPDVFLEAARRHFAAEDFVWTETDPAADWRTSADPLPDQPEAGHPRAPGSPQDAASQPEQLIPLLWRRRSWMLRIRRPSHSLTYASLQPLLDDLVRQGLGRIDYIHGADVVRRLAEDGALGFLMPALDKSSFFSIVARDGILPRKTFSMGEAREKRYYFECRRIT